MGKLTLYGMDLSPPVRAVKLTLKALNIDYEYVIIDTHIGEHLKPEFIAINPQHTIPTINDGGHILWESNAIVTYLVAKYGKDDGLYTRDLQKRSKIDQRLNFINGVLFSKIVSMVKPVFHGKSTEFSADAIAGVNEALGFLEIFLKDDPYIAGPDLSVADFCCSATMESMLQIVPIDVEKYPKLKEWLNRLKQEIPFYDEINVKPIENVGKMVQEKIEANRKAATTE